jgi:hypothetical protein
MKNYLLMLSLLILSGCAQPIPGSEITPSAGVLNQLGKGRYYKSIELGKIEVKDGGQGKGAAYIGTSTFHDAILSSLIQSHLYRVGKPTYQLDAYMFEQEAPFALFNYTVTSKVNYKITSLATDKIVYEDTLSLPCTVRFFEEPNGAQRTYRASTCSAQENITHFLRTITH